MPDARTARLAALLVGAVFAGLFLPHAVAAQKPSPATPLTIQTVDFKNFTYNPSCSKSPIRVKNGVYERTKPDRFYFKIGNIAYGDIGGDGSIEATVLSACNTGGSGVFSEGFVFGIVNGQAHQLAVISGGDRAWGSIQSATVTNGLLSIVRLAPDAPNGPACCPKFLETTVYKLQGSRMIAQGKPVQSEYVEPTETNEESSEKSVTGSVTYMLRIALPESSLLEVSLADVSLVDAPARIVSKQEITTTTQVPIAFEIKYDSSQIVPAHSYAVQARITTDGKLTWINDTAYPVLTKGNPDHVEIKLKQVN
jgi:putative lipoprotein